MIGIINALKHSKPFLHKIYKAKNGNLEQRSSDVEHFDVTGQIPRSIVFDKTGNIYSILERIGQGAFGVVKLAFNVTTAQLAAVKIQKISSDQRSAQDQLQIEEDLTKNLGRFYGSLYRTNPKGVKKHYLFMEYLRSDQNIFTKIKEASFEDKIKIAL
ncbi:MAG TPA: hypothetical protein VFP93_05215, partial [Gammaproteobacteria bacterium]|nr:hypothetical protein [Gammaproteobacteria bacterium]